MGRPISNRGPGAVDVTPLREAVAASGVSLNTIARRIGFTVVRADTARLKRYLGILPYTRSGASYPAQTIAYDHAVAICRAAGVDPVEAGV